MTQRWLILGVNLFRVADGWRFDPPTDRARSGHHNANLAISHYEVTDETIEDTLSLGEFSSIGGGPLTTGRYRR